MSRFFIERPIVAIVIAIFFVIGGAVMVFRLPVAQFPEIAPPQIQTMRDRRRERAAALRLRDPGATCSWSGNSSPSSQPVPAGGGWSSTARCPP